LARSPGREFERAFAAGHRGIFFVVRHGTPFYATRARLSCDALRREPLMDQPSLFVDTLNDAVRDTCRMIGIKEIAKALWPKKSIEEASRYLNDCLNPDRPHKLDGEEILFIARRGRELGCHLITGFICMDTGYAPPTPVDPEDTKAELQRAYIESVRTQKSIADRLERLAR
jgi:hypothetical protein